MQEARIDAHLVSGDVRQHLLILNPSATSVAHDAREKSSVSVHC